MARSGAVWAIDIGQCAMKALRCRAHSEPDRILAEAFDYIEYPKILSQPGADTGELVGEALKQFLSRNSVSGDRVAISVSGQSGLARFIKLPPVETKKIPDIVRYEARQQIPFDLNDVIWDYQRMGGDSEEEGFALETEVGLFAMKREAVFRALEPFEKAGIEVDFVQLAPLALYNFVLFDQLTDLPAADEYDPESPPDSVVILSLGTDATDLVITNGFRVWQRSIPLGGNHFTKALTKELKLTFAKAEHLKRNAATAQDSRAIFQAMRPVFRDLLTELQRSIGYFTSIDRAAKISHVLALGNVMKLTGLRKFLAQSLGFDVRRVEQFRGLTGSEVLSAPAFKDNSLCFGVCYGLALQGLGRAGLRTNLLPKEILKDRVIRQKKPWAAAAAAVLLLGCGISYGLAAHGMAAVDEGKWSTAEGQANQVVTQSQNLKGGKDTSDGEFTAVKELGDSLTGNVEGRLCWLELLRAVNQCLPPYPEDLPSDDPSAESDEQPEQVTGTPEQMAEEITGRKELHITSVDAKYVEDLAAWHLAVQEQNPRRYEPPAEEPLVEPDAENPDAEDEMPLEQEEEELAGPAGPGWVVTLNGYHYHNSKNPQDVGGVEFVQETLLKHLQTGKLQLPTDPDEVSMEELGISFPVLIDPGKVVRESVSLDNGGAVRTAAGAGIIENITILELNRFDFIVQFAWTPTPASDRLAARESVDSQPLEEY